MIERVNPSHTLLYYDIAKDGVHLVAGFSPLAFFGVFGEPAIMVSVINILVVAALRVLEMRMRSRERMEIERLRLELKSKERPASLSQPTS